MILLTRADWDGLVCAVLLTQAEKIENIYFVHPKDMQDGKVPVPKQSVIANLPYHPNCSLWFDHHVSEEEKAATIGEFKGKYALAPSAARLVYEYYGGEAKFPRARELVEVTDKIDSAQLTIEDVTNPAGYVLLSYTIDPRTGLRDTYQQYFLKLVDLLKTKTLEEILQDPDVQVRGERVIAEDTQFRRALLINSRQEGTVVITDFRGLGEVPPGNRFLIYALFPEVNISVRLFDGRGGRYVVAALGHSIFNRTSKTNIGELLGQYGGGGHRGAGTVQFPRAEAGPKIAEIIEKLKADG
ncbi:MAG: hypothetical protein A2W37_02275 [Chloroflexi bacterium RBG_16_63_12]|nr:MAG: hypothetical protein A2W37_02275 [Chloroflexi bacterium RBG_16_63_12]